jgi:hypothetical protein
MRALDGFSEQVLREPSGEKAVGQQLVREAQHIERQQVEQGKEQITTDVLGNRTMRDANGNIKAVDLDLKVVAEVKRIADARDVRTATVNELQKPLDMRDAPKTVERTDIRRNDSSGFKPSNDGSKPPDINEVRKADGDARRSTERSSDVRQAEQRESCLATERIDQRRAETRRVVDQQEARRSAERNDARLAEQREARRAAEAKEVRRVAEAKEIRRVAEVKEARRAEAKASEASKDSPDQKFKPGVLDGRKWQKDGSGNFVAKGKDGRLITHDADGKIVDYQSHVNQKHMASQNQMAFLSILFCNPLMLTGMGAALGIMDQAHAAKTAKLTESLNGKLDGRAANKAANQTGYAGEMSRKALLINQYTRPLETREVSQMNGLAGMMGVNGAVREEMRKQEIKRKVRDDDSAKRPAAKASMPTDRYSMSAKKLLKTKRLLEDEIERVQGKASLEEVSRLHAQVEVLEKALKRMANF